MNYKEIFIRIVQFIFSSFVFDFPVFIKIKISVLRFYFKIGKNSEINYRSILYYPHKYEKGSLIIGDNVVISHDCDIDYSGGLTIKNNVWISERVIIATHEHRIINTKFKSEQDIIFKPLCIEEDAWIGAGSIILSSVNHIGRGSIIGAGTVLRKNVKENEIMIGNPAVKVGQRFEF